MINEINVILILRYSVSPFSVVFWVKFFKTGLRGKEEKAVMRWIKNKCCWKRAGECRGTPLCSIMNSKCGFFVLSNIKI